jgi:hypothetical protein
VSSSRTVAAVAILAAWCLFGAAAPEAMAGGDRLLDRAGRGIGIRVTKFLTGTLDPNTREFMALNGRNGDDCYRDAVILFEFSAPLDHYPGDDDPADDRETPARSVDSRTIRIGISAGPGIFLPAEGSFYQYRTYRFDPVSQTYRGRRPHRNRVIFDPTKRFDSVGTRNPAGFEANTEYSVVIPGIESGAGRTVRSRAGRPLLRSFTTTFGTADAYRSDFHQPLVLRIEATDAPGVPLDGRTGVDRGAALVATFSEPMLESSFSLGSGFLVRDALSGADVSGALAFSADRRSCSFVPEAGYGPGQAEIEVVLTQALTDRVGNALGGAGMARFATAP